MFRRKWRKHKSLAKLIAPQI